MFSLLVTCTAYLACESNSHDFTVHLVTAPSVATCTAYLASGSHTVMIFFNVVISFLGHLLEKDGLWHDGMFEANKSSWQLCSEV